MKSVIETGIWNIFLPDRGISIFNNNKQQRHLLGGWRIFDNILHDGICRCCGRHCQSQKFVEKNAIGKSSQWKGIRNSRHWKFVSLTKSGIRTTCQTITASIHTYTYISTATQFWVNSSIWESIFVEVELHWDSFPHTVSLHTIWTDVVLLIIIIITEHSMFT